MTRYEEVKTRSVTGLAHAVETKTKLVLDICIAPATIVISETGVFDDSRAALVTDLGTLTITTIEDDKPLATDIRRSVSFVLNSFESCWRGSSMLVNKRILHSLLFILVPSRYSCNEDS